jgi:hypothetical protein
MGRIELQKESVNNKPTYVSFFYSPGALFLPVNQQFAGHFFSLK